MSELRKITSKHKATDAGTIRRVLARLERLRGQDEDTLQVSLYLSDLARRIDEEFERQRLVRMRPE